MPAPQPVPIRVVYQGDLYVLSVGSAGEVTEILFYPNKENRMPMTMVWADLDTFTQMHIENELIRYHDRLHIREPHDMRDLREPDEDGLDGLGGS